MWAALTQQLGTDKVEGPNYEDLSFYFANCPITFGSRIVGCSERQKEIKRRRKRRKQMANIKRRLVKATVSEKQHIVEKLRRMTPGAEELIERFELIKN